MNLQIWFLGIILPFLSAMLLTFWIHPRIVRIAKIKNIVDNPNSRKLQRRAVPVMGGFTVFFGIVVGVGLTSVFFRQLCFIHLCGGDDCDDVFWVYR